MRKRTLLIFVLFLLSGATGLVYQIVWMRSLTLFIGVTSKAVATILAVFMGGLSIGSWLLGRWGDKVKSPIALYCWLELGIGAYGFFSLALLDLLQTGYVSWVKDLGGPGPWTILLRAGIAAAALLPPTILMGATFPVLLRAVHGSMRSIGKDAGILYAVNTLGAVAGTLGSGLFLIRRFGLDKTVFLAASVNICIGLLALALRAPAPQQREPAGDAGSPPPNPTSIVVFAFCASGFLALAYEVVWTRYLVYVLGANSVYAFTAILAAFLSGICLGSWMAAGWVNGKPSDELKEALGIVLMLVGMSALLTIPLMSFLVEQKTGGEGFWASQLVRYLKCLLVLMLPTILSGSVFALVAAIVLTRDSTLSRDSGVLYAYNTIGAVAGAAAAGFLLLPWLGLVLGIAFLASLNLLLGLSVAASSGRIGRWRFKAAGITAAAAACYFLAAAAPSPVDILLQSDEDRLLFYRDGAESSIAVIERPSGHRHLVVDGDIQAGTEPVSALHLSLLGHLPALFHPDPRQALVIAFGTGISAGHLLAHEPEDLDIVELSPDVIRAAELFGQWNRNVIDDRRVEVIRDDGRNFLLTTDRRYDLIITDPLNPDDAGMTNLYSKEYYELVHSRLRDGGLTSQWLAPQLNWDDMKMFIRTFTTVFPNSALWDAEFTTVIVGIKGSRLPQLDVLRENFRTPQVRETFASVGIQSVDALLKHYLAGPETLASLVGDGPINTDRHPLLEYIHQNSRKLDAFATLRKGRSSSISEWLPDRQPTSGGLQRAE